MLNFKTNHKQAALKELICHADAILVGAGAGLSASAGLTYSGNSSAARGEAEYTEAPASFTIM